MQPRQTLVSFEQLDSDQSNEIVCTCFFVAIIERWNTLVLNLAIYSNMSNRGQDNRNITLDQVLSSDDYDKFNTFMLETREKIYSNKYKRNIHVKCLIHDVSVL